MKYLFPFLSIILLLSCTNHPKPKLPVYAWLSGPGSATDKELKAAFVWMKNGAAGICLFTPGRMTRAHWEAFEKAIKKNEPRRRRDAEKREKYTAEAERVAEEYRI